MKAAVRTLVAWISGNKCRTLFSATLFIADYTL